MATIEQLTGMDEATAAQSCQAEHTKLVKMLMASIDLVDHVQRGGGVLDVAKVRKHIGPILRHSAVDHATALAALVLTSAPEYAEELIDYAESVSTGERRP